MATDTASTGRESDKFMLRLPEGMRSLIKEAAEKNGRTMNAEIISRLDATFAPLTRTDDAIQALALRLAQTEFDLRLAEVESGSRLLDAHFAAQTALDLLEFNGAKGYAIPVEVDDITEVKKIYQEAEEFLNDQTPEDFDNAIKEMTAARDRMVELKPSKLSRKPTKRKQSR